MKSVRLASLTVPSLVQNGTVPFVILDCPYYLRKEESKGMVLKWYFNSKMVPIYQWVPPSPPQSFQKFKGRVDLDFEISSDPYTRHTPHSLVAWVALGALVALEALGPLLALGPQECLNSS